MPVEATSTPVPTSPRVLTPSQTAVVALHAAAEKAPSPNPRGRSGSFVPLQRLECVQVAKELRRDGRRVYVASVFLHRRETQRRLADCVYKATPTSKLSAEEMRAFMMSEREPDYSVEHPFSEFRQLRDSIIALLRTNRAHVKTCTDCQDLLRVMRSPQHHHWTVKRMFGNTQQRFALLTAFVNDLVTLTASAGERTTRENITEATDKNCHVWERVGKLLQEFLRNEYKQSLGII